eukprot:Nitzschia sp. Nitz4//scaffold71_size96697//60675//66779//NITZ4_004701-RA/size96697-processed-gene-0.45-mRNA-1//-1//CDS//3329557265//4967//frame0
MYHWGDDDDGDKENSSLSRNTSSQQRKNLSSLFSAEDDSLAFSSASSKADEPVISDNSCWTPVLQAFQQACDDVAKSQKLDLTLLRSKLGETIVRASLNPRALHGVLLVEEHASTIQSTCRKLLKLAPTVATSSSPQRLKDILLVVVHCLRALGMLAKPESVEPLLKLLYHTIASASCEAAKKTSSSSHFGAMALSGLETMQTVLKSCFCLTSHKKVVGFKQKPLDGSKRRSARLVPVWSSQATASAKLTFRQTTTMVLKSLLSVVSLILEKPSFLFDSDVTSTYGVYVSKKDIADSTQWALDLLTDSYSPWLSFAAQSGDTETLGDLSSHCRSAHRLLWETASKMRDSRSTSRQTTELEATCLNLRCCAIEFLLPHEESDHILSEAHWETACTYAWKAATVFVQQTEATERPVESMEVQKFYDRLRSRFLKTRPVSMVSLSMSWLEFCVYQGIHCAVSPTRTSHPGLPWWQLDVDSDDDETILLSFFLLCAKTNHELSTGGSSDVSQGDFPDMEYVSQLIQAMNGYIHENWIQQVSDAQTRLFKLVSMFTLHRSIFQALKESDATCSPWLSVASMLLYHCVAPITVHISQSSAGTPKAASLYESTVECYIRPLAAFQRLAESSGIPDECQRGEDYANSIMHDLYMGFFADPVLPDIPDQLLERIAKSISLVARQRLDQSNPAGSLIPSFYSISVYRHLSSDPSTFQISVRLTHLASALQECGLGRKSLQVLMHVICQEASICYRYSDEDATWAEQELFETLAARCKDVFLPMSTVSQPTTLAKSAIRRLLALDSNFDDKFGLDDDMSTAWMSLWGQDDDPGHSLFDVFSALVGQCTCHEGNFDVEMTTQFVVILADMLVELGSNIAGLESVPEGTMQNFLSLFYLFKDTSERLPFLSPRVEAAMCIMASTALIPMSMTSYLRGGTTAEAPPCVIECAKDFLNDAYTLLKDGGESLLIVGVAHYTALLQAGATDDTEFLGVVQTAVISYKKYVEENDSERHCLLWHLVLLHCRFASNWDSIHSKLVMRWLVQCINCEGGQDIAWFYSFVGEVLPNVDIPVEMEIGESCGWDDTSLFVSLEMKLAAIRRRLRFSELMSLRRVHEEAKQIAGFIDGLPSPTNQNHLELLHWVLSSSEQTLGECSLAAGNYAEALQHFKDAGRHCLNATNRKHRVVGDFCFWERVVRSTMPVRATLRYAEMLQFRVLVYSRMGDHRKATAYMGSLADFLRVELRRVQGDEGPHLSDLYSNVNSTRRAGDLHRFNAELRCASVPLDMIVNNISKEHDLRQELADHVDTNRKMEELLNAISVGNVIYGDATKSSFQQVYRHYYEMARSLFSEISQSDQMCKLSGDGMLQHKMALLEFRCMIQEGSTSTEEWKHTFDSTCGAMFASKNLDPVDKSWLYYYSSQIWIQQLREHGVLQKLWSGLFSEISGDDLHALDTAKSHLRAALQSSFHGSAILRRKLLRCLALVAGPEEDDISSLSAGILVLESIAGSENLGIASTEGIFGSLHEGLRGSEETGRTIRNFFNRLAEVVPSSWKIAASCIVPTGDILLTSIEFGSGLGSWSVRTTYCPGESGSAYNDIVSPLDEMIQASQDQLSGMDETAVSEKFGSEAAKRDWWSKRHVLDENLQTFLQHIEDVYFHSLHCFGSSNESIFGELDEDDIPVGSLQSRFDEAFDHPDVTKEHESEESLKKLTVPKLKERLVEEYAVSSANIKKLRKQELIDLLLQEIEKSKMPPVAPPRQVGCLLLILDENLHRVPFEGMPSLFGNTVCRVPGLAYVLDTMLRHTCPSGEFPMVDPSSTRVILDPERNLVATRKRLSPVLDSISGKQGWSWDSVVGEIPSPSFFENGLQQESGILLYFGHGGAQNCFSRKQVEALVEKYPDTLPCRSSLILMGCSSGRLVSINRKHSRTSEEVPLYYQPEGIALTYLEAGAPCVVGNLWDVTDHDIDRFSERLLRGFYEENDEGSSSLAGCVASARDACKLKYIVGCAPVCYGIPVQLYKRKE